MKLEAMLGGEVTIKGRRPCVYIHPGAPEEADLSLELTHRATRSVGGVVTSVLGDSFINLSEKRVKEQAGRFALVPIPWLYIKNLSYLSLLEEQYFFGG